MVALTAFLTALPAFLASLPYLFQLLVKVMTLVERLIAWSQQNKLNDWLNDVEKTIDQLEQAKTPEQKRSAAKGMVDLIRTLR